MDWLSEIDALQMFSEPVAEDFHDYHMEIRHLQDYSTMRQGKYTTVQGKYTTVQNIGAELRLVYANALKFSEEGDKYWMLAAHSFQQAASLLQIAQDKFQTAVRIDLLAIPSPMPVDVHEFIEQQIGNLKSSSSKESNHERSNDAASEVEALLLPPVGTPTVGEADLVLYLEVRVGLVPHQVALLVDDRFPP